MIFGRVAQDTITDLRRRLDDAVQDNRRLTERLLEISHGLVTVPQHLLPPAADPLEGIMLPSNVMDEIELAATSGAMARHLEKWALGEVRKGTALATIVEMIRDGEQVQSPPAEDE